MYSADKKKKKLKLYNPENIVPEDEDLPDIANSLMDFIKYLLIYAGMLIITFFLLIIFIINSLLFYFLFSLMTVFILIFVFLFFIRFLKSLKN